MNAAISLDLDNKWTYLMTHGNAEWQTYPSYLATVVPRIIETVNQIGLKLTFFIVGKDAVINENREALRSIVQSGHQVGNHSLNHKPWLHRYSEDTIINELRQAHSSIREVTGREPIGFRGPGFSLSRATLEALNEMGYIYDASTFPTFIGPLARLYYFSTSRFGRTEKEQREKLFGTWSEGLRPIRPYYWKIGESRLIEIPVTTMPLMRFPFHVSYLLYVSCYSKNLAKFYFQSALALCKVFQVEPSLLLHPLDFLGREDVDDLSFFPAMKMKAKDKLEITRWALSYYAEKFNVYSLDDYALHFAKTNELPHESDKQLVH